ncbi:MAG: replicative DNA helicase [Candidatus Nomurabacteria bacterium]|nr:MAG: replicative DNA helicase [Candidatus Nomurabacteria bacterium]HRV75953.1 replicative DNA helicase [Candidatus Saccharimonadales bacterium]
MANKKIQKLPPQNLDAEKSLLGSVLISQDAFFKIVDIVKADDFYENNHKLIYAAIVKLTEEQKPVDLVSLTNALSERGELEIVGGSSYIAELTTSVATASHAKHYADIVSEKSLRRRLISASEDIIGLSYDEADSDTSSILDSAEQKIFNVAKNSVKTDLISIETILTEQFDKLELLHQQGGKLAGIPTGFIDIDKKLAGLNRSDLIIIAARPAMGKTTLALNIAHNIAIDENLPVLFFSLEMSKEQLVDKMLSTESGVDNSKLRTGNLTDEDFENLSHAWGALGEANMYIDDTPGITVTEMRAKARRLSYKQKPGLIVVDYLQLMSGTGKDSGNRVQEVSEISRGLKILARELDVPIIALSQLSRSVESRHPQIPQLADLRESGSIEQDADIVAFLYREEYYNPETEKKHITDLIIAKFRNGPTGKVELYFKPDNQKFMNLDRGHRE